MVCKQVRFRDRNTNEIYGGIGLFEIQNDWVEDLRYIICGCCGAYIDMTTCHNIEILDVYDSWMNLCDEIIGN